MVGPAIRRCIGGNSTLDRGRRLTHHGPGPGGQDPVGAEEHEVDTDLHLDHRLGRTRGAGARHKGATVSGRVVGGGLLWRQSARYGQFLGGCKSGCIGRYLGPGPSLQSAHDIHRHEAQHRCQEQQRSGENGHGPALPGWRRRRHTDRMHHPVSWRITALADRSMVVGNSHWTSGTETRA